MKSTIILPAIFLAVTFSGPAAYGLESSAFVMEAADAAQTNTQYAEGTRAINDGRWTDAEAIFTKIAAEHGDRADAATYWKAYAENKEGKADRAIETCATLRHSHADSRYISDCDALRVEIQGSAFRVEVPPIPPVAPVVVPHIEVSPSVHVETHITGRPPQTPSNPDEDLKLLALQAVMQQDESRALPIIQQILKGNGSEGLKQRALFVLAQSNTPQAKQTLGQIARDSSNPGLQLRAIKIYAAMGGKGSVDTLSDIYQHSSDKNVKRAILQSYLITGSSDKLLAAARSE
ncbi:MAG TPA: HEAT repeat domain-containing protein, partial [Edaphobacter sp.]|nr:HEAT repeat domain-containing protein [Edaphobacter sp.]